MKKIIAVIILAAGRGTRMKSQTPKVLHTICGRPMISYSLDLLEGLKADKAVVVLGHGHQQARPMIKPGIKVVIQKKLLGTADAVKRGLSALASFQGTVLVLYADNPLLKPETIKKLLQFHLDSAADATILTAELDKPAGYGRILRGRYSSICGIVEEKDADDFQKDIKEVNTGIAAFNKKSLESALKHVTPNNRKKEYYLTDAIGILYEQGGVVDNLKLADFKEALGVNSRADLASANKIMRSRINEELMKSGVTIVDPESTFIDYDAKIAGDCVIYPFTVIEKNVKIGKRCQLGPFVHIREGTHLADDVTAGNFLEIVRSNISAKTLIKHFSYLGDTRIGTGVNIGAGCVTANFNGQMKNLTVIKDKAFIGSNAVLVAPVEIGKRAVVGAGAVVVKNQNVADGKTVAGVPARPIKK